jgi:ribonuclease HIII
MLVFVRSYPPIRSRTLDIRPPVSDALSMAFLVGTDEAGYGPNLGPLVVSASVWRVPPDFVDGDLYGPLADLVGTVPADDTNPHRLVIADSKQIYKSRGSLVGLEIGVLAALGCIHRVPRTSTELWQSLASATFESLARQEWFGDFDFPIPVDSCWLSLESAIGTLRRVVARGVQPVALRSVVVFPDHFNRLSRQLGTKAALLSNTTLDLVVDMVRDLPPGAIRVVCDKHGGRNNYAALLQTRFEDRLVRVGRESREESSYEVEAGGRPVRIEFRPRAESYLPSALASMTSKYLRELAMMAFNRFWRSHVDGLEPTAGYHTDATRFRRDIEPARARLGIPVDAVWRTR